MNAVLLHHYLDGPPPWVLTVGALIVFAAYVGGLVLVLREYPGGAA